VQDQKKTLNNSVNSVAISATLMALGTLASRVLGLVRESLFAALFPRWVTDAWYVAFKLPNIFRRLFGEGSLSVSFIPVFIDSQKSGNANNLVNGFFFVFSAVLLSITVFGIVFMESWLKLFLDQNYIAQVEKYKLTILMARIMFAYIYLVCTYAFIMAILNAIGQFGRAALAPAFFNIIIVISTLIPSQYLSWTGQSITWGVIIGGLVQLGVLIPPLVKSGYLPRFDWKWDPDIQKVILNMLPGLAGMGLFQVMTLVNMWFASQLENGVISYINLADRVLELPLSLISVSLGVALLPTLSRIWVSQDKLRFGEVSSYHLRLNLFLSIPCAVAVYVLSEPIIELLFQRGQFTYEETLRTALVLRIYAFLIVVSSLVRVFVPNFYAIKNTWYPAVVSAVCLVFHIFMTSILIQHYHLSGLVSATVLTSFLNFLMLAVGYHLLIGRYPWGSVISSFIKFLIPGLIMFFTLHGYPVLRNFFGNHLLAKIISLGLIVLLSGAVYLVFSYFMGFPEIRDFTGLISKRLSKKLLKSQPR